MPNLGDAPTFPTFIMPQAPQLPRPVLEVPRADLPSYKPLVVPPSQLKSPAQINGTEPAPAEEQTTTQPPVAPLTIPPIPVPPPSEVRYVDVPGTDIEVPLPSNEILATAASTAAVSVAVTLTATSVFKKCVSLFKPIIKQLWTRLTKKQTSSHS